MAHKARLLLSKRILLLSSIFLTFFVIYLSFTENRTMAEIQPLASKSDSVFSPSACAAPPSGLVSWWRAEGNANDVRGLNNGNLRSGTTFEQGKVGQEFYFDSLDDGVRIPASSNSNISNGTGITFESWINPTDISVAQPLFAWKQEGGNSGVHFVLSNNCYPCITTPGALYGNFSDPIFNPDHVLYTVANVVSPNSFQHVAFTYDRVSGIARIYHNGNIAKEQNLGTFPQDTSYDCYIGYYPIGGSSGGPVYFRGGIDEPSIYNRALTAAEIQSIYNADSAGKCFSPSANLFDYDGDRKSDLSIFRSSNGQWWLNQSSNGLTKVYIFGQSTDKITPADYTGDGKTDVAFFRNGTWFVLRSENETFYGAPFGAAGDVPAPGDYDGDGKADLAVFRNGTWFILRSTQGTLINQFGTSGDIPTPAAYIP